MVKEETCVIPRNTSNTIHFLEFCYRFLFVRNRATKFLGTLNLGGVREKYEQKYFSTMVLKYNISEKGGGLPYLSSKYFSTHICLGFLYRPTPA